MVGGNEWEAAFQKAKLLVGQMTLEEKVSQRDAARAQQASASASNLSSLLTFCLLGQSDGRRHKGFYVFGQYSSH